MIHLRELYQQVGRCRSDLLTADAGTALVEASIKLAKDTFLLKDKTFSTLPSGGCVVTVTIPGGRDLLRVEKVEFRDPADADAQWIKLDPIARVYQDSQRAAIDTFPTDSSPYQWSFDNGKITFQSPSDADYALRISYAWAPTRFPEPINLPFPTEAEEALVNYAESRVMRLSGKEQNWQISETALSSYKSKLSGLKAMADTGSFGSRHVYDCLRPE